MFIGADSNGEVFNGEFSHGLRNGYGRYEWGEGDVCEGNWKDDAMDGFGYY